MGVYKRKDFPASYYIRFKHNGKIKRISVRANNYNLAEKILNKKKAEIAENKFLDIKKEKLILIEDIAKLFLEKHSKVFKKSFKKDISRVNVILKYFRGKYLQHITVDCLNEYVLTKKDKVKTATINRELACLKTIFNKAIEWGYANENPVRKVKLLPENNMRIRYLEKEEIDDLLKACNSLKKAIYLKPIIIIALNTGMRRGEIFNLKWEDAIQNVIHIRESKSGRGRFIPMNNTVKETLKNLSPIYELKDGKSMMSEYIFRGRSHKPIKDIRTAFRNVLKEAGISNFRFHDLRHTFASHLVMSGVDLLTVKELLGHRTLEMTMRYAHLSPDYKQRAVIVLDRFFGDTVGDTVRKLEKVKIKANEKTLEKQRVR